MEMKVYTRLEYHSRLYGARTMRKLLYLSHMLAFIWGFLIAWAQVSPYPDNPYHAAFQAAYAAHPRLPRGVLEAIAYTQSRFYPVEPDPEAQMPQPWGLFGWIENGRGHFRENLRLIVSLSGISADTLKASPLRQVEAMARAYEKRMTARRISPADQRGQAAVFVDLSYIPLRDTSALRAELQGLYRFLADSAAARKYGFTPWTVSPTEVSPPLPQRPQRIPIR